MTTSVSKTRIKLVAAFLLLLVMLGVLGFYFYNSTAEVSNVFITNLSSNTATVSWQTDKKTYSELIYSTSKDFKFYNSVFIGDNTKAYDDRNLEIVDDEYKLVDEPEKFITHHVTLRDLEPETIYYFKIKQGVKLIDLEGDSFETFAVIDPRTPDPIYGKIALENDTDFKINDGVIYYNLIGTEEEYLVQTYEYSSVIEDSNWSGDIANILQFDGEFIVDRLQRDYVDLNINVVTDEGSVRVTLPLENYRPLETIVISN